MKHQPVPMRINVAGFKGEPVSMFAAYDPGSDMLLVRESRTLERAARPKFLHVSNIPGQIACDTFIDESQISDAITAFFMLQTQGLIKLETKAVRFDPANKIERDGMDDSGIKYRIAPDISNGQVAIILAAFAATRQRAVAATLEDAEDLMSFF